MLDPSNLSVLKVTELKAELKKRGLPVGGVKSILIERLQEDLLHEQAAAQAQREEEEQERQQQQQQQQKQQEQQEQQEQQQHQEQQKQQQHQQHDQQEQQQEEHQQKEQRQTEEHAQPEDVGITEVVDGAMDAHSKQQDVQGEEVPVSVTMIQDLLPTPSAEPVIEESPPQEISAEEAPAQTMVHEEPRHEAEMIEIDNDVPTLQLADAAPQAESLAMVHGEPKHEADMMEIDNEVPTPQAESLRSEEPTQQPAPAEQQEVAAIVAEEPLPTATSQDQEPISEPVQESPGKKVEIAPEVPQEEDNAAETDPVDQHELTETREIPTENEMKLPASPPSVQAAQEDSASAATSQADLPATVPVVKAEPEKEEAQPEQEPEAMDTTEDTTDIRKRKRRSLTPAPSATHAAPEVVQFTAPEAIQFTAPEVVQQSPDRDEDKSAVKKARCDSPEAHKPKLQPQPKLKVQEQGLEPKQEETQEQEEQITETSAEKSPEKPISPPTIRRSLPDARFKGLFNDSAASHPPAPLPRRESYASDDASDDGPVHPSIHPATRTLYIRDLMRPLSEAHLKAHLTSLASRTSSTSEDHPAIEFFYLDNIKSHAFITFSTLTAATRVRVGIHGRIWPNERNRKELWADFVPEERVHEWVQREKEQRGRWEVDYRVEGEGVEVELVGEQRVVKGIPTGPRAIGTTHPPTPITQPTPQPTRIVKDLDELFRSTSAKPKLYWMPVSDDVARERLESRRSGKSL